jgi:hypothetical protein
VIRLVSLAEDERSRANEAVEELNRVQNQLNKLKAQAEEEVRTQKPGSFVAFFLST